MVVRRTVASPSSGMSSWKATAGGTRKKLAPGVKTWCPHCTRPSTTVKMEKRCPDSQVRGAASSHFSTRKCLTFHEELPLPGLHLGRFDIVEVDRGERFFDVQVAGPAIEADAVPVEDAVGGIGVLLDLDDHVSAADSVDAPARDEDGIPFFHRHLEDLLGHAPLPQRFLEGFARRRPCPESGVQIAVEQGIHHIPHLALALAAIALGHFQGRMDLDRKPLLRIEQLTEEREALRVGKALTENCHATVGPEFVEGNAAEGAVVDDALGFFAIDDFPRFTDA